MAETHAHVQELLNDVRAWTPVFVEDPDGNQHKVTGLMIEHDEDGAQTKAVLQTKEDGNTPSHLA